MGRRNVLIDGGSGTGKTSVATEFERRGHHVVHGDRVLARPGDPLTGEPLDPEIVARDARDPEFISRHHVWDVALTKSFAADRAHAITFFCGACRNRHLFVDLFDLAFALEVDWAIVSRRLDGRPNEWGFEPAERALIERLHLARTDMPAYAISVDAARPVAQIADAILARCDSL